MKQLNPQPTLYIFSSIRSLFIVEYESQKLCKGEKFRINYMRAERILNELLSQLISIKISVCILYFINYQNYFPL